MTDALEVHEGTVSMGGRTITNFGFADDIDGLAGEDELAKLVEHLDKACSEACLFFGDDLLCLWLQSVQYDLQHDFALVTDEADSLFGSSGTAAGCLSWEV